MLGTGLSFGGFAMHKPAAKAIPARRKSMPADRPRTTPHSVLCGVSRILYNLSRLLTQRRPCAVRVRLNWRSDRCTSCSNWAELLSSTYLPWVQLLPDECCTSLRSTERRHRHRLDG